MNWWAATRGLVKTQVLSLRTCTTVSSFSLLFPSCFSFFFFFFLFLFLVLGIELRALSLLASTLLLESHPSPLAFWFDVQITNFPLTGLKLQYSYLYHLAIRDYRSIPPCLTRASTSESVGLQCGLRFFISESLCDAVVAGLGPDFQKPCIRQSPQLLERKMVQGRRIICWDAVFMVVRLPYLLPAREKGGPPGFPLAF